MKDIFVVVTYDKDEEDGKEEVRGAYLDYKEARELAERLVKAYGDYQSVSIYTFDSGIGNDLKNEERFD